MQEGDTSSELAWVRQALIDAGETFPTPHALVEQIVKHGQAVVPPLLDVLQDRSLVDEDLTGASCAPIHALVALSELRATEAIPAMLALLAQPQINDLAAHEISVAMNGMGVAVVEPVFEAHAACTDPMVLWDLESLLVNSGAREPRILDVLVRALDRNLEMAATLLVDYGDPAALEHLHRSLDHLELDEDDEGVHWKSRTAFVLIDAILKLGGTLSPAQEEKRDLAQEITGEDPWRTPAANPSNRRSGALQRKRRKRKQQKASRKKNRR